MVAPVVLLRPAAAATKNSGASGAEDGFIDDVIRVGLIGGDVSNKKGLNKALFLLASPFPTNFLITEIQRLNFYFSLLFGKYRVILNISRI